MGEPASRWTDENQEKCGPRHLASLMEKRTECMLKQKLHRQNNIKTKESEPKVSETKITEEVMGRIPHQKPGKLRKAKTARTRTKQDKGISAGRRNVVTYTSKGEATPEQEL